MSHYHKFLVAGRAKADWVCDCGLDILTFREQRETNMTMADQKPKVTLGYAQSRGEYYVSEIMGNKPTVSFIGARVYQGVKQARHARIGDWLSAAEAEDLGEVADLTVRPYRLEA